MQKQEGLKTIPMEKSKHLRENIITTKKVDKKG